MGCKPTGSDVSQPTLAGKDRKDVSGVRAANPVRGKKLSDKTCEVVVRINLTVVVDDQREDVATNCWDVVA